MDSIAYWHQEDTVLEPHTKYRLKVVTRIEVEYDKKLKKPNEDLWET